MQQLRIRRSWNRRHWIAAIGTSLAVGVSGSAGAGSSLTAGDLDAIELTAQDSLEYGLNHQRTEWVNPESGNRGAFTPTVTHGTHTERCREYRLTATLDGRHQQTTGTACRHPDGFWRETTARRGAHRY